MGDVMGLSLDEIIKKSKRDRKLKVSNASGLSKSAPPPRKNIAARRFSIAPENRSESQRKAKPIVDARNKIIEKKRANMVDAREKLIELTRAGGDARQRLLRKGLPRGGADAGVGSGFAPVTSGNGVHKGLGRQSLRQQHNQQSPNFSQGRLMDYYGLSGPDELDSMEIDDQRLMHGGNRRVVPIPALKRTVMNESYNMPISMPPLPTFRTVRQPSPPPPSSVAGWMSDPFECYEPIRRPHTNLQAAHQPAEYEPSAVRPRSSLRPASTVPRRPTSPLAGVGGLPPELLSSTMRARLERAPNPAESMGIFAKMPPDEPIYTYKSATYGAAGPSYGTYTPARASPPRAVSTGFRIIVSNLHHNVTQQDITELFEDIGDLLESRLVRTGVAEVIYRTLADAEKAVDAYHNRQLDGQPMNCLLVHPRSSAKHISSAIKYGSSGTTVASAVPMTTSRAVSVRPAVATIPPGKTHTTINSNNFGGRSNSASDNGRGPGGTNKPDCDMVVDLDTVHSVLFRRTK